MAAVSMRSSDNTFGCGMINRLSPAFRTLTSPRRPRFFDLEKMRELARSDEFSDSESDGVESDEEDEEEDVAHTILDPTRRSSPKRKIVVTQWDAHQKQLKKSDDKVGSSSPQGDEWEIVDKSPTFESVAEGKADLGGESWFVQECE
ncbi:hypothetical protein PsorP6_014873 [Peronosclerospora sorghi]|uniref:Uncharacterized protein n=1 Tax=Peronosclerospora sorghi TaxID=230839 RepID=A0ACC0VUP9_9STRA|nr:hypothetical protein PsorP6_014873 [Peronosclerospora sorghi]